ncbi:hypothetical protein [Phage vB_EcoM-p111]|nr:hypothetical protein [Phage vB_EcoM-p111]
MALIKASYTVHRAKAYAGQIADTSLYNVDGACAAAKSVKAGVVVALDPTGKVVDGHKVVTDTISAGAPNLVGVAIMSHAYSPEGVYDEGSAINVLTNGRAWVLCAKDLPEVNKEFNKQVFLTTSGTVAATGIGTAYTTTGEWLKTDDESFDIIKIQVTQAQFQLPASPAA